MRSRILLLAFALLLGGTAAALAVGYIQGARSDIASEGQPIEVLVAQEDLPRGLSIAELSQRGLVKKEQVPRRFVAADALSSLRVIEGQVLAAPLCAGEQLTKARFQYASQAGLSYTVPEDLIAMAVQVDEVSGVAGLLKPGDHVVVFGTMKPGGNKKDPFTIMLVSKCRVLAVGTRVTEQMEEDAGEKVGGAMASNGRAEGQPAYRSVTLALTAKDASRVTFVQEQGAIQLALLSPNAAASKTGSVSFRSISR